MVTLISAPSIIESEGNKPKVIKDYVGRVNSRTREASVARMNSPTGWEEPGQTPEFDEYTLVLAGILRVSTKEGNIDVAAGQAVIANKGEWVRYSSPYESGADYVAVCVPAFGPESVKHDP
ncbi:MAG: cupin [Proteobacteria bacterium]|nr:cupin [Pseudomonadota bacterium]MDA1357722.1 cupin [Pseudomonadota bacterium]